MSAPWISAVQSEEQWLASPDPLPMLMFMRGKGSVRKHCLFQAACCRRIWHFLRDDCTRKAVEVLERFADDETLAEELSSANADLQPILDRRIKKCFYDAAWAVHWATIQPAEDDATASEDAANAMAAGVRKGRAKARAEERMAQAALLRDIVGNPFRRKVFKKTWRTPTVQRLTETTYHERAFDRIPILADALEEAGCTDTAILVHCREEGTHVLGCWVVDLILGNR
jgi:hypothetical protein